MTVDGQWNVAQKSSSSTTAGHSKAPDLLISHRGNLFWSIRYANRSPRSNLNESMLLLLLRLFSYLIAKRTEQATILSARRRTSLNLTLKAFQLLYICELWHSMSVSKADRWCAQANKVRERERDTQTDTDTDRKRYIFSYANADATKKPVIKVQV